MRTLKIRARKGSVNHVADFIFDHTPNVPETASTFQLIEDTTTTGGSGDQVFLEIVIRYENPEEENLKDIETILEYASSSADEIEITKSWDD